MEVLKRPLEAGLFSAFIVTVSGYVAENYNAYIAGLFAATPVALFATLFLKEKEEFKKWIEGFSVGIFIYLIVVVALRHFNQLTSSKEISVALSFITWITLVSLFLTTLPSH